MHLGIKNWGCFFLFHFFFSHSFIRLYDILQICASPFLSTFSSYFSLPLNLPFAASLPRPSNLFLSLPFSFLSAWYLPTWQANKYLEDKFHVVRGDIYNCGKGGRLGRIVSCWIEIGGVSMNLSLSFLEYDIQAGVLSYLWELQLFPWYTY